VANFCHAVPTHGTARLASIDIATFLGSPIIEVHDLSDAFSWGSRHIEKLSQSNTMDIHTLIETLSGRTLSLISTFCGIRTDMITAEILQSNYKATTQRVALYILNEWSRKNR
jgi:hypothetical protein